MATEKVKANKTTCDGCGSVQWHDIDAPDPVLGFHGHIMWHGELGGGGFSWYACSDNCIGDAVLNARKKMWSE